MVRATRSSQIAYEDPAPVEPIPPPPPAKKVASKKRKRLSETDDPTPLSETQHETSPEDDKSVHVAAESERDGDKEEAKERPAGKRQKTVTKQVVKEDLDPVAPPPTHKDAGDVPLSDADAESLLNVLEAVDPDSLLDRLHDLHSSLFTSPTPHGSSSVSLRQILNEPSSYNLRAVRSAIQSLSVSPPTSRAAQSADSSRHQQFCNVALGLLHEISTRHAGAVDATRSSLDADVDIASKALLTEDGGAMQYALHQQLPSGDFFTSAARLTAIEASGLVTGQASLVAVQPSVVIEPAFLPKLGSYNRAIKLMGYPQYRLPTSKTVATGTLLDYGPFASFAPIFDADAGELTERELADLIWSRKKRVLARQRAYSQTGPDDDVEMEEVIATPSSELAIDPTLGLDDALKMALEQLQMESGIDDLLVKNATAMQKLVALQNNRYRLGERAPPVQPGGEEWTLANSIQESLSALTSLRPRRAGSSSAPLVPPLSILRALQRTLPIDPTPGWKGTLARDPDVAYRDNSTITAGATPYINPVSAPAHAAPPPKSVPAPAMPSYPQYPQYQRPGLPATTSSYYPSHSYYAQYANPAATAATAGPKTPATPAQQYYYPYPQYPGYMQGQMYNQVSAYGQQPGTPGQPPRAIPNMAKPAASPYINGWAGGGNPAQSSATLPPHLRKTGGMPTTPGTPGTPMTPMMTGYGAANPGTASPVYPPAMTAGYGTGYAGWPQTGKP